MMNPLLTSGLDYLRLGLSVVPAGLDKRSVGSWRRYQTMRMTAAAWTRASRWPATQAIAIVCGGASGQLEVLDIDTKNDLAGDLFARLEASVRRHLPQLWDKLVIARTPSGGYHLYYRCRLAGRTQPLARRPATRAEKLASPAVVAFVLIEVRACNAYVLAEPTPGYRFVQGSPATIPVIDDAQRDALRAMAVSFNTYQPQTKTWPRTASSPVIRTGSPLDDYDRRGKPIDLLVQHGWTVVGTDSVRTCLRRPGATSSKKSGDFHHVLNRFGVFSTSAAPFEIETSYRPSAVYALLECGGDFTLAARKLSEVGYGIRYQDRAA